MAIFNIFFILGTVATIKPLPFNTSASNTDALVMIAASVALFLVTRLFTRNQIGRTEGVIFISFYALYLIWIIIF